MAVCRGKHALWPGEPCEDVITEFPQMDAPFFCSLIGSETETLIQRRTGKP